MFGPIVSGLLGGLGKAIGAVTATSNLVGGLKNLSSQMFGQNLNTYAPQVEQMRASNFQQLANASPTLTSELIARSQDPANSKLGQALIQQGQMAANRALGASLLTGQANSYDVSALQNRATEQGISAITGQLSGLASQSSRDILAQRQALSGASPALGQTLFGSSQTGVIGT